MFNYKLFCLEGGIIGFIAVTALVVNGNSDFFDAFYGGGIQSLRGPGLNTVVELLTYLGNWQTITIICLLLLAFSKTRKTYGIPVTIVAILSQIVNRVAKEIIARPRPDASNMLIEQGGYSYPSGHAATAIAVFVLLAYLICKNMDNKKRAAIYATLLSVLAILISLSRVYLGVHYASDVLGGFFVGLTCFGAVSMYFYPYKKEKEKWRAKMKAKDQAKIDALETVEAELVDRDEMIRDVNAQYEDDKKKTDKSI